MIRAIVIDDERLARVELISLLADISDINVVGEAVNADQGITAINKYSPDLIFLDVQMPGQSGFDMLELLDEIPPVIFTTAYDEYAIKAFEFNALDYLLKPIQVDRLAEAIQRVHSIPAVIPVDSLVAPFPSRIYMKADDQSHFVLLSDIALFSSYGNYVNIHFNEKSILVHRSLNQVESRLDKNQFFRANRYSIINVDHMLQLNQKAKGKLEALLTSGHLIEFSERKSVAFRELYGV